MPEEHVNGIDIHYEVTGSGRAVLFLHGLGSSTRDWEEQTAHFSSNRQVITVDFRGHGQSDKPAERYSIEGFAADTAGLIKRLQLDRPDVVGISLGGMVGFQLAADHAHLVGRLVAVNAVPEFEVEGLGLRFQVLLRKLLTRFATVEKIGEVLAGRLFPEPGMEEQRKTFVRRWADNDQRAYRSAFQAILDWEGVAGAMTTFDHPTLFIVSDEDYTPVESKRPYVDVMPNAEMVVIENARHAVPAERPHKFNSVLEGFLESG
ncbi:MAG: alpha/beta hydrolase [Acidimicrobiia bacterium]|nr:alpha/beta hydrolase [Acidimicrobiia bacterium]